MSDIESTDWSEIAANNIQPAPGGWPPNSSPNIVYSNGREDMGAIKRDWNRRNPTATSGGSANAHTLTYSQGPTAYVQGQTFTFICGFTNNGPTTLNVQGLGAKNIFFGGVPLNGGELVLATIVQVAYDSVQFNIIGASAGKASAFGYLSLAGGSLSGILTIAPAAGSASVILNKAASGLGCFITGQTASSTRWQIQPGNGTAETGSNVGSDFAINRFTDGAALIDTPFSIARSSGITTLTQNLVVSGGGAILTSATAGAALTLAKGASGFGNFINCYTGNAVAANLRWQVVLGNNTAESGSNNGSDVSWTGFTDTGTVVNIPLAIKRSTGVVTFAVAIVNGPSDRSLKENIAPLENSLDKVQRLQGVSFDFIRDETKRRQLGLIAQDVAPIVPEVMQDYIQPDEPPALAIDYTRLVPLLVEAIKELTAKVTKLEAGLLAAPKLGEGGAAASQA